MTQLGKKYQPYRFGSGVFAPQYLVESTARQDSRSHIGKVDYLQVIGNRATLDTSFNVYGNHFPLTAHTDKTPIIDDVTFARRGAYNTPGLLAGPAPALQRGLHALRRPPRHQDRLHVSALRAAIHRVWRSGAGRHRRPLLHRHDQRRAELVLDRQRTGVERQHPQEPRAVLPGQVSGHVETDAQLRPSLRSVPQLLSGAAVRR